MLGVDGSSCLRLDNGHVKELMIFLFWHRIAAVIPVNGGHFLPLLSESSRRKTGTSFMNMTMQTIFKVKLSFRCSPVLNNELQKEKMTVHQDQHMGELIGFCSQRLLDVWKELFSRPLFTDFFKWDGFVNATWKQHLSVPVSRNAAWKPLTTVVAEKLVDVGSPLKSEDGLDTVPFDRSADTDDALSYVNCLMLGRPHSLILNRSCKITTSDSSLWKHYNVKDTIARPKSGHLIVLAGVVDLSE